MKRFIIACAIVFMASSVAAAGERSYRIATVEWIGWSPLQIAHRLGFWDSVGVDVTPVVYDDPVIIFEAVRAGRCQFAMDMVGTLVGQYLEGLDVVLLFESNWSHGGDKIIHENGASVADLKGETIGVFLNYPSCLYFLDRYLSTQNLGISDFRIVEVRPHFLADQFIAGRIPVIVIYEPHASRAMRGGDGIVAATSAMYEGCIPECMWTYRSLLKDIPSEDVCDVIRGWIDTVEWILDEKNFDEYMRIINEDMFVNLKPMSEQEFRCLVSTIRFHSVDMLRERNLSDDGLRQYLVNLRRFLDRNGMLERDYKPEDLYTPSYITDVLNVR